MKLRPVEAADLPAVSEIYEPYVLNTVVTFDEVPRTIAEWEQKVADVRGQGMPFLILEVSGQVAGFGYAAQYRPKSAYARTVEDTIYLAPDFLGKGLGRPLLEGLIAAATDAGAREMIAVIADTGNDASVRLHKTCGFTEAGTLVRVGYKLGTWVDTILMQRSLGT